MFAEVRSCCLCYSGWASSPARKDWSWNRRQLIGFPSIGDFGLLCFSFIYFLLLVYGESVLALHSSLSSTLVNGSGRLNHLGQGRVSDCSHSPSGPQQESSSFFFQRISFPFTPRAFLFFLFFWAICLKVIWKINNIFFKHISFSLCIFSRAPLFLSKLLFLSPNIGEPWYWLHWKMLFKDNAASLLCHLKCVCGGGLEILFSLCELQDVLLS